MKIGKKMFDDFFLQIIVIDKDNERMKFVFESSLSARVDQRVLPPKPNVEI